MTLFWILAAAMVVAVLATLAWPLLRSTPAAADGTAASNLRLLREQLAELDAERAAGTLDAEQHATARAELERRVLEETREADTPIRVRPGRASALVLAVALPAAAVLLYARLGNPQGMDAVLARAPAHATEADVETLVQRLADRMKAEPGDPAGWALLGRAYAGMQRWQDARDAFAEAVRRSAPDPGLLADYADVLAMAQGQSLAGEPERLVLQALALDPDHLKSLALAGSAAFERGDAVGALKHWERAKAVAPTDSPFATGLDGSIAEARAAVGAPAGPARQATPAPPPASAAASGAPLRVTVRLAPALAARVPPGATLFVFARAAEGPRMPLAIVRQPAGTAPVEVVLDDRSAMTPELRLSAHPQVVVGARISASGNATPQPGDLEGQTASIPSSGNAEVLISVIRE